MANRTVMILGAGAVRAAAGKQSVARRPPLDRDFVEVARKIDPQLCKRVESQLRQVVGTYTKEVLRSLENTTTLLYLKAIDSSPRTPAHLAFLDQLDLLGKVLAKTTNRLPVGPRSLLYRLLRREVQRLEDPTHLTIITFNYDLMIERTLDEMQEHESKNVFSFPECYRLPGDVRVAPLRRRRANMFRSRSGVSGIPVLKLHGSLNWQSTHNSKQPKPSFLFDTDRHMTVINCSMIRERIFLQKSRKVYLKPIILPPVSGKRGLLHDNIVTIWTEARSALQNANRVVILGYSCPPLDFEARMLLGECVQPETTSELCLIDPNPSIASRFVSLCGVPSARIFVSVKEYVRHGLADY